MPAAKKTAPKKVAPAGKWSTAKRAVPPKEGKPEDSKPGPKPVAQQKLDTFGIEAACANIVEGKTLTEIAKLADVSIGSLLTWLAAKAERSARAREARKQAAKLWDEQALEGIQCAKDAFTLSKAKEAAHHLRWRASKIAPRDYGDKLGLGAADDLPPLPQPVQSTTTNVTLEVSPGDAYRQMLTRKGT